MTENSTKTAVVFARCPDCGEKVRLQGRMYVGKEVVCQECDAVLEVIDIDPVELDWPYEDEDEYDDEDEDED